MLLKEMLGRFLFLNVISTSYFAQSIKPFSSYLPSSESESEEEEEIPLLSEEEMNKLGARLVKAEIMGNTVSRLEFCLCQKMTLLIKRCL